MAANETESWAVLTDTVDPHAVSVREIVAFNLARGRRRRDLSQADLGARLTNLTGMKWSPATVSAAEKGWNGKSGRVRKFDVDEVIAFACALELPLDFFFQPPGKLGADPVVVVINKAGRRIGNAISRDDDPKPYAVLTSEKLREIAGPRGEDWLDDQERHEELVRALHDAVALARARRDQSRGRQ